ncbi:hypothetical protein LTR70_010119 [Exophiala xenobiotica]|uniref:Uncharacterized protein n=1 Tax=Lithohypha guttulata TaxID=1690604 RepID=A0ABR0JV41_9EURO|nr:hypothetical protein LTR24_010068 [Lithohypha guttulata]KAK5309637.1 hypothetical protein LTR70_010119 [Exophiala xenobiotica]
MHQLDQGERLRSFIRDAVDSPQATLDGTPSIPMIQTFVQELQNVAVAVGKADERSDGFLEHRMAGASSGLDMLVEASAQAQAMESEHHPASTTESENSTAPTQVRDHCAHPEDVSATAPPSVDTRRTSTLPPRSLATEVQEKTTASAQEIKLDREENILRLYPTKA